MSSSARALEERGKLSEAADAYLAAGEVEQCARVLAALERFADAARVLTATLGDPPWTDEAPRALAYKAATYLWHAGDSAACAALLFALGDDARASAVFHETGVRLLREERREEALAQFLRVSAGDPSYRSAAAHVIDLAVRAGAPTFPIIEFLRPFVATPTNDPLDVERLFRLGALYQDAGLDQDAHETLSAVLAVDPSHPEASARMAALPSTSQASSLAASLEQDLSFWAPARPAPPPPRARKGTGEATPKPGGPAGGSPSLDQVIAGRYRLEAEIGRGGMGAVYRALDLELEQLVALKLFTQPIADANLVARFKQELMLCRQITHRNVIRVYDIGSHEGRKFLTMELLTGRSLRTLFGNADQRTMLAHLLQVTEALGEVHRRGIVHRDVKPANVFVTTEGVVKLMDFGLAKRVDQTEGLTASGFMAGSPGYMAPEQVTSFGTVGPAADLYAFGVILYEVLTGVRPFRHKDANRVIHLQFTQQPQPPSELQAMPHPGLEPMVLRLLDRDPEQRPHVEAVQSVLRAVLTRRGA